MIQSRLFRLIRAAVVAVAMIAASGLPDAQAQWHGGGGGWHGSGGGWHGGGGWGWHGGGWGAGWGWRGGGWCCGWGWGFGFALPPLYYALPPVYYYPPPYYPPPAYGAYGYGSYGPAFHVSPPPNQAPTYQSGLDPNNCGTPDQPMPCSRR